ncbi:hypothetical protein A3A20_01310 [Candidatus Wolfebacteria bacterium RIFCSPLOWO2_01_FULL_45_19]|uniref:Uncharacterized protein n=1 Tax=Candidatus Wolfebacteria bacterium RIFCSPLOWO2_01_FULL_45_19 TaxID=1802557 RepID=A0A1F8DUQ3_9BACT|nr:MAG: hypothetical protein A3A20_01310 [Candidatus Wolfebacteria bacterium RIFCSPLOWO2_01_FULL_45_19]
MLVEASQVKGLEEFIGNFNAPVASIIPLIVSLLAGETVPMPTLPVPGSNTKPAVLVALPTRNPPLTSKVYSGVIPMPMFPLLNLRFPPPMPGLKLAGPVNPSATKTKKPETKILIDINRYLLIFVNPD